MFSTSFTESLESSILFNRKLAVSAACAHSEWGSPVQMSIVLNFSTKVLLYLFVISLCCGQFVTILSLAIVRKKSNQCCLNFVAHQFWQYFDNCLRPIHLIYPL